MPHDNENERCVAPVIGRLEVKTILEVKGVLVWGQTGRYLTPSSSRILGHGHAKLWRSPKEPLHSAPDLSA